MQAIRTMSLQGHGDFMKLWLAQTISVFGTGFTQLALPLIAANVLRVNPAQMGILNATQFAPFLLLGLFVGVWVDNLPRRLVLIVADVGRAVVLTTIPLAVAVGVLTTPLLYVVGFLIGVLTVFFDIAYQAYLPSLVARDQLVEGNSRLEASRSVAQIASPGIAGVIIEALSASAAIVLDAISFVFSGALIGSIRHSEATTDRISRRPMWVEIREGLSIVFGIRVLRSIAGCTATFNLFASAFGALLILFFTRDLGLGASSIGLVFAVGNIGGIIGATVAARITRSIGVGSAITVSALLTGCAFLPAIFVTPSTAVPILAVAYFVMSFSNVVYNVNQVSLRQAITPLRAQGRMNATMRFAVWGVIPIGSLIGGLLGETFGLRGGIAIGVVGAALAFLWVLFSPVRSLKAIPVPEV